MLSPAADASSDGTAAGSSAAGAAQPMSATTKSARVMTRQTNLRVIEFSSPFFDI
jgi:hypothetical protein